MKNLRNSYIIALSLIAVFIIISQLVIQTFLVHQESDAKTINIAGRQRMLSQKLAKHCLIISKTSKKSVFQNQQKKLNQTFKLWHNSHKLLLKGNKDFEITNSEEIKYLFEELTPFKNKISEGVQQFLKVDFHTSFQSKDIFLQKILDNEPNFLSIMNQIVSQYELEAKEKVKNLSLIEEVLMLITILVLLLEALLIFRPIVKKTRTYVLQIQNQNEELLVQEEELRQNLEELHTTQEVLEKQQIKLKAHNEEVLATDEELRQNLEELVTTRESLEQKQKELKIALAENVSINNALDKSAIISITDLKGDILRVNDIFCEVSGFTKEELISKNQNIVNSGYHSKEFWTNLWGTIGTGNTWRGEIRNKNKSGIVYWVDAVVNPIYDENGKIYRYLSVRYVITDKKKHQDKIIKINDDLNASIQYAKRIQNAILVKQDDIKKALPSSFIFFKPRDVVSGDFYFYVKKDYKVIIAAVDCTGHGIPGAFMSLIANNLLQEIINQRGITAPAKILNLLKMRIIEVLKQKENNNQDGVDIAICSIDQHPEDMEEYLGIPKLAYAGAANPLIYFQNGEMNRIKGDKIIIGGFRNYLQEIDFQQHIIPLDKPTTFYIFSDGIQDQFGEQTKRKFSNKRLRNLLQEIHPEPPEVQKDIIEKTLIEWQGGESQIDDMLLIGVKL